VVIISGTARQAADDNVIWCMYFACCVTKVTDTDSYLLLSQGNSGCANVLRCYSTCTLPVMFFGYCMYVTIFTKCSTLDNK
jgi:hypothetical protein